ncbi:hypothetical protein N2152v2_005129 [Parachlorella kessleri]
MTAQTRLELAFEQLVDQCDILAVHDCECCSTCAHSLLAGELESKPHLRGYVFYHGQDLDSARDDGELYIRFASRGDTAEDTAAVGQAAAEILRACGLEVYWSGESDRAIHVTLPDEDIHFLDSMRDDDDVEDEDDEEDDEPGVGEEEEQESEEEEEGQQEGSNVAEDYYDALEGGGQARDVWLVLNSAWEQRLQASKERRPPGPPVRLPYTSEAFELA